MTNELILMLINRIAGRHKAAHLFGSLVILDVVCRYLSLLLLYINKK